LRDAWLRYELLDVVLASAAVDATTEAAVVVPVSVPWVTALARRNVGIVGADAVVSVFLEANDLIELLAERAQVIRHVSRRASD
jgi:hypothetical protein